MAGKLIGVGVGPGDPELLTLKAVRTIRENDVIALPGPVPEETAAYRIAVQAVPDLAGKILVPLSFPMVMDRREQERCHREGASILEGYLSEGRNVVFLTLGDAAVYSTFSYVQHLVEADGYETALVSGIPSFCAAAAALNLPLAEWTQPLHILPAVHRPDTDLSAPGNYVLMKSGTKMKQLRDRLRGTGKSVYLVENCGMPDEKLYLSLDEIPDRTGYFSLLLVKEDSPGYGD